MKLGDGDDDDDDDHGVFGVVVVAVVLPAASLGCDLISKTLGVLASVGSLVLVLLSLLLLL